MGADDTIVRPGDRVIAIVGNYGSGKTELAVNLSLAARALGPPRPDRRPRHRQSLLPLPRSARADGGARHPRRSCRRARRPGPTCRSSFRKSAACCVPPTDVITIFDVGGDDVGARALASFRTSMAEGEYELWQVINAKRPFTDTVEGCLAMRRSIEGASRWTVTGLLVNSHLIDETTVETVLDGWRLAAGRASPHGFADSLRGGDGPSGRRAGTPRDRRAHPAACTATCCRRGFSRSGRRRETPRTRLPAPRPVPIGRPGRFHSPRPKEVAMGRIDIDSVRCKGCGRCITACPKDLIEFSQRTERPRLHLRDVRRRAGGLQRLHDLRGRVPGPGHRGLEPQGQADVREHDRAHREHDALLPGLHPRRHPPPGGGGARRTGPARAHGRRRAGRLLGAGLRVLQHATCSRPRTAARRPWPPASSARGPT